MAEKKVTCKILRDFWPKDDDRVRAGTIVEMSVDDAMDGMEKGLVERVKDEPAK